MSIPFVSLLISLIILVESLFKGSPLSPPVSLLYLLFNSGLCMVVLHTIKPSTYIVQLVYKGYMKTGF